MWIELHVPWFDIIVCATNKHNKILIWWEKKIILKPLISVSQLKSPNIDKVNVV